MQRYGAALPAVGDVVLEQADLFNYLREMDCDAFAPLEGVLVQTEALGDPATPGHQQMAALRWLGEAYACWEQNFPLEEPLASHLRRLKPLLGALAVSDPAFFVPGAHPLHQLLDTLQAYAIGWQPRLGRVGQPLEKQVRELVDSALTWFDAPSTDLAKLSRSMLAAASKSRSHAERMARRLEEAEQGRTRMASSKRDAALMINASLERYAVPVEVAEFLQGPWYDSAQLALLKFGADSREWSRMVDATTRLLQSFQQPAGEGGQQQFADVAELARDLRGGLYSLQHDRQAIDAAVAPVERLHQEALRQQPLDLRACLPIPVDGQLSGKRVTYPALDALQPGQWLLLDTESSPQLRVALALRLEETQQLLFVNHAGLKVLETGFNEFAGMVDKGKVTLLASGASFSRCLAACVGIKTRGDITGVSGAMREKREPTKEPVHGRSAQERQRLDLERAEQERAKRERQQRKQAMLEQLQIEEQEALRLRREREVAEQLRREQAQHARLQLERERERAQRLQQRWQELVAQLDDCPPPQSESSERQPLGSDNGLNIPRCTWVGFRDDDQVELALLAAHRPQQDQYLFVDRYGRLLRKLSGRELLIIITRGAADILASRSRFREEVRLARDQGDAWVAGGYRLNQEPGGAPRHSIGQRCSLDIPLRNSVFIELVAPEFGSKQPGTITRVWSEYAGGRGLQLALEHPLPAAAIMQIAVAPPGSDSLLYLVAEVTACHPVPRVDAGADWTADLTLVDVEDSDIRRWQALLESLQSEV